MIDVILFLFIALSVVVPLLASIGLPVQHDPEVKQLYDKIEGMDAGETIVISFDYDPASGPELKPMAEAIVHHAFRKAESNCHRPISSRAFHG